MHPFDFRAVYERVVPALIGGLVILLLIVLVLTSGAPAGVISTR
jgi:hypothetical protein